MLKRDLIMSSAIMAIFAAVAVWADGLAQNIASAGEKSAASSPVMMSATIEVQVSGLKLIDPAAAGEKAREGQGHLHYRVDEGPVIATPAAKLSFHGLKPGRHTISVALSGNDHAALGPSETLSVTVP